MQYREGERVEVEEREREKEWEWERKSCPSQCLCITDIYSRFCF